MQIRKYLNGELNATAMHKLEREALDDPFLMDALEGYGAVAKDQQDNLNELSGRLVQRTNAKSGRIIQWKVWSIAASVIIVLTIGGLWLKKAPVSQKVANVVVPDKTVVKHKDTLKTEALASQAKAPLIAQNSKPAPVLKQADKPVEKQADNAVYQQEISAADNNARSPAAAPQTSAGYTANEPPKVILREVKPQAEKKDNTQQLSEMVVMNYTQQSKQDSADNAEMLKNKAKYSVSAVDKKLQGKVEGLTVVTSKDAKTQFGGQIPGTNISGIIISKDDGSPVIGAAIRVKGTNKSTVTNTYGHFALPASGNNKETLDIVSIGYEKKQINAKAGDSLKVELDQDKAALSEVVVVGYGTKKEADEETAVQSAHPQNGWSDLKKYLQANTFLPDGTTGNVNVIFTVATDGTLSDFKIKKSLNTQADQKAIDLIKNGPSWVGNNSHKPEQVTIKVKFQKQK
ncbi:carboxypeptidase-like regulatory domain-containing protein [Mucilaginibacter pocheonensis]|uniref:carboxypeptidase-like regulatory domain-containing protein n=1 Tax=Mucilaginibacter pocheonensis TaxID=398050 RepID=UPI00286B9471|nr:carboxypeptidase-like regulatory domain-containing protein [Mucilaginibacter pocheonensis]